MEALKSLLPLIVTAGLAALVLAIGLDARKDDALFLIRQPRKLLKAVVAISIVVPIVALGVIHLLPLRPPAKFGLMIMAIAPLPPFLPGKAVKASGGDRAYVYGLYVAFSVLTVAIVPATVALLSALHRTDVWISPLALGRSILVSVLLPLAAGMAIRARFPALAGRLAPLVGKLAMLFLLLIVAGILGVAFPAMLRATGDGTLLGIALIGAAAIAAGHLLGGPDLHERIALAASATTRHPGIALLIVKANDLDRRVIAVILLFVIVTILEFAVYQAVMRRASRAHAEGRPAIR
jgi:BASS family bile acid:Na+ symporter